MLEQLYDDLVNSKIPFSYYFDCFRYFYYFDRLFKFKSDTINCDNFYTILEEKLSDCVEKIVYNENEIYFEDDQKLKSEFIKIQKLFDERNEKNTSINLTEDLQNCNGGFIYKDYEQISIKMRSFLGLFKMDILKKFITDSTNEDLRDFLSVMTRIYEVLNVSEFYSSDKNSLQEVLEFVEEIYESAGNIRKVILDSAKDHITKILKRMEIINE